MLSIRSNFKKTWLATLMSLVLFVGVTYFIVRFESRTIRSNVILEELVSITQSVDVHNNDQSLINEYSIHIVGPINIIEPISDPDYNIEVQAVKLRKRVQMYQWIEETNNQENDLTEPSEESQKTYWYHKDWKDYVVDSSLFYIRSGHENPSTIPILSETYLAEEVKIGWVILGLEVKRKVDDYYEIWSDSRPERNDIKLHSGHYYHGESALHHNIGDLRIHFSYAGRQDDIYTAVGVLENGVLNPYTSKLYPTADPICLLRKGSFNLKQLYDLERRDANINSWKYRLLGLVQVFASAMTLHPMWINLLLESTRVSNRLRECSRVWVISVLSISYTLIITSIPWLLSKTSLGLVILGFGLYPLFHYSTFLTREATSNDRDEYCHLHDH